MRNAVFVTASLLVAWLVPAPASAWGFAAHRYIMGRAIDLLPPELKPFYEHYRDEIVLRSTDPDLWRTVGWEEDANHFINFGVREYGAYPFRDLPREYGAAIEKFGMVALKRNGLLAWRPSEQFGNLRRTFEGFKRGSAYGPDDVVLFSAVLGHYIQDAHQPLHISNNYDGQLTGNAGIHSRFERDLLEKFLPRLTVTPAAPKAITNPRDATFDILLSSYPLVAPILKADTDAAAGREAYDDEYFDKFFRQVRPILEERLGAAITATAGVIIGAWEQAGRPALQLVGARPVQKIKKQ